MSDITFEDRYMLVKQLTSRWNHYKLLAKSFDINKEWNDFSTKDKNPIKKAEHRLYEDSQQLKSWIDNPPELKYIMPKLIESNKAYAYLINHFAEI